MACENQHCLDLTLNNIDPKSLQVERLMTALNGPVLDHKQKSLEQNLPCSEAVLKVELSEIEGDMDFEMESEETKGSQVSSIPTNSTKSGNKFIMISCCHCNYSDILPIDAMPLNL